MQPDTSRRQTQETSARPAASGGSIPLRKFGKHDVQVSALGLGGHHLGDAEDEQTAIRIVHEAVDNGITFFDNCWEYHRGKSEDWMGKALKGRRDKTFLMTKVCTHGRDASLAMQMLEQSLNRLQTDHLDLWQIHGVTFDNDPELFIRPGGAAEALQKAKQQGKVRFVGFTGHKDPTIHLKMLQTDFPFDAVQMPLNSFDANFHSFRNSGFAGTDSPRHCAAGNEAVERPWRSDPTRCGQRGRSSALCDEPAGNHYDYGNGKIGCASPKLESRARLSAYDARGNASASRPHARGFRRWTIRVV